MRNLLILSVSTILFVGCTKTENKNVKTWIPIYATITEYQQISSQSPAAITRGGKIALAQSKVYMVEQGAGIHIINYSNPDNPVKERFIKIPGCYEVSMKNGYLIVNNGPDLVSLDISLPDSVRVISRLPNVFKSLQEGNNIPPDALPGEYFECPDGSKGIVIKWMQVLSDNPKCKLP